MYDLRDYFRLADDNLYASELFYILEGLPYDKKNRKTVSENIGSITVEKSVVSGNGLDISKCEKSLLKYKNLLVFDNALVFSLVVGSTPVYEYSPKNDVFIVNDIGVVGKVMYMSKDTIASPVQIPVKQQSNNNYFLNFKEYFLNDMTEIEGDDKFSFEYKDNIFEMKCNGDTIIKMLGVSKEITYSYVLFVLDSLPKRVSCYNVFVCQKIERK